MVRTQELDFSIDLISTILWQFDSAIHFVSLIEKKEKFYKINQQQFWESWVKDVFDLRTANEFGLSVWSIILELPLFSSETASPGNYPAFGFDPVGENFENGNFATTVTDAVSLPIESKRALLRLKYFNSVVRPTSPAINKFLRYLFGRKSIYVIDNLNMTMTYIIESVLVNSLLPILQLFDLLPRPSGVEALYFYSERIYFGFDPAGSNFNNSNFIVQF